VSADVGPQGSQSRSDFGKLVSKRKISDVTVRFYIDPATEQPHIYGHSVLEEEVEDVLARPMEDSSRSRRLSDRARPNRGGLVPASDLRAGPHPRVGVCHYGVRTRREGQEGVATAPDAIIPETMKKQNRFPPGWNDARVRRVLAHYEAQSDTEAVAEDEAAYRST
jgi:hypothetical protein